MNPQRILIVEDDGIVGRDLQETLVRAGYSVPQVADSAGRALELADEIRPDLVLMDISLGENEDGTEVAKQIQQSHAIPVVYLTGGADEALERRARQTFPYGYVIKPFAEEDLLHTVKMALSRHDSIQQLEASEQRFISTLRSIAEGLITTDLAGNITFLNPTAESITGWTSLEACGLPLEQVFKIREPDGCEAEPLPLGGRREPGRYVLLTTRDGEVEPIEDNTAPIKDDEGSLTGLVVVFRRRRASSGESDADEDGEAEGSQHLVKMVESIVDPMFTMDRQWRITYVNSQGAGYFGSNREDIIGRLFWDDFPRHVREKYEEQFEKSLIDNAAHTFEFYHEAKTAWCEVSTYPFADGILVIFKDITDKKMAEEERLKFEKLEGLGYLARGFAHDFNNLLTVLLGNLSLAAARIRDDSEFSAEINAAKDASIQAQNLVQQLLTFAKGGAPIKRKLEVGKQVEDLMAERQAQRKESGINYFYNLAGNLWPVLADPDQMRRLLFNLVRNAEQAVHGSGDVMVHCKNLDLDTALPDEALHLEEGNNYLLIKIIDNGEGIPESIRHQIFEPYFSSRERANASGLGLTVCESIAKAHSGFIIVDSKEHRGTTVSVYLPAIVIPKAAEPQVVEDDIEVALHGGGEEQKEKQRQQESRSRFAIDDADWAGAASAEAGADEEGHEEEHDFSGRRRILVLEDEVLIRELIARNLGEAGYEVRQAAEGGAAVSAYRDAIDMGRRFDLVLMDLSIPEGMGGAEAMAQIRHLDPAVAAIVSSGYSDDPVMANFRDYGFSGVLPKPYEPQELRRLVAEVLEESEAGKNSN